MTTTNNQMMINEAADEQAESEAKALARWHKRQAAFQVRAQAATAAGSAALARLLHLAETRDSGQIRTIATFLGACWNGRRHFNFYDLRSLDVGISDDMLAVLDAMRWGQVSVEDMAPNAGRRIEDILGTFGLLKLPA